MNKVQIVAIGVLLMGLSITTTWLFGIDHNVYAPVDGDWQPPPSTGWTPWDIEPIYVIMSLVGLSTGVCAIAAWFIPEGPRGELAKEWTGKLATFLSGMIMSLAFPNVV